MRDGFSTRHRSRCHLKGAQLEPTLGLAVWVLGLGRMPTRLIFGNPVPHESDLFSASGVVMLDQKKDFHTFDCILLYSIGLQLGHGPDSSHAVRGSNRI